MAKNPRDYPGTFLSAESGRVMTRGENLDDLSGVIKDVSKLVYEEIDAQR